MDRLDLCDFTEAIADKSQSVEIFRGLLGHLALNSRSPALKDNADVWTYQEVIDGAIFFANQLARIGVDKGDIVVVLGDRCAGFVVHLIGVLMAGARFVVIDRKQATKRYCETLLSVQPKVWLIRQGAPELSALIPSSEKMEFVLHEKAQIQSAARAALEHSRPAVFNLPRMVTGCAQAYLIWTSGTSGVPKLVSTLHRSVVNFIDWYVERFSLSAKDSFSLLSGLSHDPVLRDIFVPLSVGAQLHIPTEQQRSDPVILLAWIAERRITVMHLTPALMDMLDRVSAGTVVETVRLLAFGGDQLTRRHVMRALALFPNAQIVNFYGATETPQAMGFHLVDPENLEDGATVSIPIGRGIRGTELLVLDDTGRRCAPGQQGEIYVRSLYLSEGYVALAEATRERFMSNPLTDDPNDRVFKTGDCGVYLADGTVRLIGRIDRQVKISGQRVDLDDVETEIKSLETVSQAAVVFDAAAAQVTAYVVLERGATLTEAALREHLAENGCLQFIPAKIAFLTELPITRNGKIDYRQLALLISSISQVASVSGVATTAKSHLQGILKGIWSTELSLTDVNVHDSFFDIGGNSMVALRIVDRIEQAIGRRIRVADLFIHPTIKALEAYLTGFEPRRIGDAENLEARLANRRRAISRVQTARGKTNG